MTQKIYLSPVASRTVDAKLNFLLQALDLDLEKDDVEVRSVLRRNDLDLENTEDAPYAQDADL